MLVKEYHEDIQLDHKPQPPSLDSIKWSRPPKRFIKVNSDVVDDDKGALFVMTKGLGSSFSGREKVELLGIDE